MKTTPLSQATIFFSLMLLIAMAHAQASDATSPESEHGVSKVRIVRLSQVKGTVQIARSSERSFEAAVANLPIVENNELRTGVGIAEVEFEDNSSMRLAPNTTVEFPVLARNASGTTGSSVHVINGTVYISLVKSQNKAANEFQLIFADRKLELSPSTHIRLDIAGSEAKLAVLDGEVRADGNDGTVNIAKKRTATFNLFSEDGPTVAKDVEKGEFDAWDHTAASYHSVAAMSAFSSPYAYGTSDMAYYGAFSNFGSCGSMWRPYFASAAWDPFANGSWAYYQGAGYSWVSPYPWAWTPYHSGAWSYCPDAGWGWMPSGGWYGVNNTTALIAKNTGGSSGGNFPRLPPPHQPLPHQPTVVAVSTKALIWSNVASPTAFQFRRDSAGLGVPRGTLGHLDKLSRETVNHGVATTQVYVNIPQTGQPGGRITMGQALGATVQRGSAPSSSWSPSPSRGSSGNSGGPSFSSSSSSSSVSSGRTSGGMSPSAPSAPSSGSSHK